MAESVPRPIDKRAPSARKAPGQNPGEEGYTEEQFQHALKIAGPALAAKVKAAKARGSIGVEESERLMDAALNAEA